METNDRLAFEKLLDQLRAKVHAELAKLDRAVSDADFTTRAVKLQADNVRDVAMEALSEIRNIRANLAAAADQKGGPGKARRD